MDEFFERARIAATALANRLQDRDIKIVFAESCTAGLVSGILAQVPGISQYLCGSLATYRDSAKISWLGIDSQLLEVNSAVSAQVTLAMAQNALLTCPEATCGVAITGHLNPDESPEGAFAWLAAASRSDGPRHESKPKKILLRQETRIERQWTAAISTLDFASDYLQSQ